MSGKLGARELSVIVVFLLVLTVAVFFLVIQPAGAPGKGGNKTPQANKTETTAPVLPPPQELTPPPPSPPPAPKLIGGSIGQILDAGLERAEERFYQKGLSGEFDIERLKWAVTGFNESPDAIPLKEDDIRASPIRFNDRYIDSLRGFAFSDYQPKGESGPDYLLGTMVFISAVTPLDGYAQNSSEFVIQYDPHPELSQMLEKCRILTAETGLLPSGNDVKIFDFECKVMYGASP